MLFEKKIGVLSDFLHHLHSYRITRYQPTLLIEACKKAAITKASYHISNSTKY